MNRLGVLGWPVAHSRSPAMQNAALAAAGLRDWHYQLLPVPPELFEETVRALPASGFRGANVTIPHKHAALALASTATARATAIGAANTLTFGPAGEIHADNTDAPALIASLTETLTPPASPTSPEFTIRAHRPLAGTTALVLGAGGTARAAVWALTDAGADVHLWNRTEARAHELVASVGGAVLKEVSGLGPIDVLINCTSIGLRPGDSVADLPITEQMIEGSKAVVDFVYTDRPSELLSAAAAAGVPTVSGLELLVGQGALSYESFTGHPASVAAMRAAVGLSSAP